MHIYIYIYTHMYTYIHIYIYVCYFFHMHAPENRAERPPIYGILVGTVMNGHWVFMDFGAPCFQSNTPQWLFLEINVGRYCAIMSWSFIHSSGIEYTYKHTYVYVILGVIVSACMCVWSIPALKKHCPQTWSIWIHIDLIWPSWSASGWSWLLRESSERQLTCFEAPNISKYPLSA